MHNFSVAVGLTATARRGAESYYFKGISRAKNAKARD
jgi:hypothetical protein